MSDRCLRCIAVYGQTGRPSHFGSDPGCAFSGGVFNPDNWNCATAGALRDRAEASALWSEDQYAALLPWDGDFILLSWYKRRGRTEGIWLVSDSDVSPLTLEQADDFLKTTAVAVPPPEREE